MGCAGLRRCVHAYPSSFEPIRAHPSPSEPIRAHPSSSKPIRAHPSPLQRPAPRLRCQAARQQCSCRSQQTQPANTVCRERLGHVAACACGVPYLWGSVHVRACTREGLYARGLVPVSARTKRASKPGWKRAKRWLGCSSGTGPRPAKPAFADPSPELASSHRLPPSLAWQRTGGSGCLSAPPRAPAGPAYPNLRATYTVAAPALF